MPNMPDINERRISRRAFAEIGGLAAGALIFGSGLKLSNDEENRDKKEIAALPQPSYTQDERIEAEVLIKQGNEYLQSLVDGNEPKATVDLQSSRFNRAEEVMKEAIPREQKINEITGSGNDFATATIIGGLAISTLSSTPTLVRILMRTNEIAGRLLFPPNHPGHPDFPPSTGTQ